jgi:ATP-binding protein involved in chromosome partitioning
MPPGTGDAQITITQKLSLSGALIVSTPQELALSDARRGVTMFQKVQVPILGIVENMSYFVCGSCGAESHIFGKGGAEKLSKEMSIDVLGKIPLQTDIQEGSDQGVPLPVAHPDSTTAAAYNNLAALVWKKLIDYDKKRESSRPNIRMT